ncbi:hypothetical protein [Streptacidiphilus neutrinimicus]|uniref:hypothetical protein n=1 Tax=Streptacidiphilus neutrinimicus TaxID=105420 RepID=UPI0005AA2153|nr:hypothetical protein [Streptacidiphilus neutrinimicus]
MSSHARFSAAAAALAAAMLAVATGAAVAVPADSSSPGPSGPPPLSGVPSSSATPSGSSGSSSASPSTPSTTWKFYSVSTSSNLYTSSGQVIANPSTAPAVGDYAVSTDNDYAGTHTNHSTAVYATDHLYCLFTKAPATATCSAQIATSQGMLIADNSTQDFASQAPTQTYTITSGTGAYQGAKGTVVVTPIANSNNADFVVTWSR